MRPDDVTHGTLRPGVRVIVVAARVRDQAGAFLAITLLKNADPFAVVLVDQERRVRHVDDLDRAHRLVLRPGERVKNSLQVLLPEHR